MQVDAVRVRCEKIANIRRMDKRPRRLRQNNDDLLANNLLIKKCPRGALFSFVSLAFKSEAEVDCYRTKDVAVCKAYHIDNIDERHGEY
jgi:hypothetical protein